MKILTTHQKGEVEILFIKDKKMSQLSKSHKDTLSLLGFEGLGNIFIPESKTFFIGLQKSLEDSPNTLRDSLAQAIISLKKLKIQSISLQTQSLEAIKEICEGIWLGDYTFETFKSKKSKSSLKEIYIHAPTLDQKAVTSLIEETRIITQSVNTTRELINTPPMEATPQYIMNFAKNLSKKAGFECKVYDKKFLEKEKMGAFLAVSRASCHEPYLVHLSYKPKTPKKSNLKKFVFVGKGLTYDCGGLSLKPGDYMTTMKADKSGACAVIGILDALARLGVEAEVHGVLGMTENMIGGDAYKPDDILIARNGKSIEVRNTDAEGRLVLADCLSYASDLKPDFLIDLATLTGACVVALGDYTMGIMGYSQKLKEDFLNIAYNAGELGGILPFNPYLKKLYKSEVADLCNIPSSRYGSAITAGMFLGEFIEESLLQKWLHLDIAGPAYVEKSWGVNPFGATGAGVRACIEFVRKNQRYNMGLSIGIVGLPNVGKSTTFNALTKTQNAQAANYPFCTIEPNKAIVPVPDERLEALAKIVNPQKIQHSVVEFVDIAGLVKGASQGEGLGNQFLANIRETEVILHIVRCFEDSNVTHVEGNINPLRDIEIIETELLLADMQTLQKRIERLTKNARSGTDKEAKSHLEIAQSLLKHIENGKAVRSFKDKENEAFILLEKELRFLTNKTIIYAANVDEEGLRGDNTLFNTLKDYAKRTHSEAIKICSKIEEELVGISLEEQKEFLEALGIEESGLDSIIALGFKKLGLISYFTAGVKEVRSWTIRKGDKAPKAAGVIHKDFEKGFIKAEVIAYEDFIHHQGESKAKEAGTMRIEGKDYIVQDGDIMHFRFNVSQ